MTTILPSFTFTSVLLYLLLTYLTLQFLHTFLLRRTNRLPPGPFPLPVIGNLLNLSDKPHQSFAAISRQYGPIISLRLGSVTTVVVTSVSAAEEVLKKNDVAFSDRYVHDATTVNGHHEVSVVFMPPNSRWRNLRKICHSYLFSTSRLDATRDLRLNKVAQLLTHVDQCSQTKTPVNIGLAAFTASQNLLSNTFFSTDINGGDSTSEVSRDLKDLIWSIVQEVGKPNIADFFPWLKPLDPQGVRPRIQKLVEQLFAVFDRMIDPRFEMRKSGESHEDKDVLDILLSISEGKEGEEGSTITMKEIKHLLSDLFTAGTDTTSSTIEWAMAELLHNPTKLQKTQSEIRHLTTSIHCRRRQLDESDIVHLPYLQAVVKETLRLHPPTPLLIPRKTDANVSLANYTIPKNTQIFVNVWAMGRDPIVWGDNAEVFEPERFIGSEIDYKGCDFELIPFGAGRRICPGLMLAHRMIHLVIGSLLNEFDWELPDGLKPGEMNMDDKFGLTLQRVESLFAIPVRAHY